MLMADKELRRMSRPELIEIIYALKSNEEVLKKKNAQLHEQLDDRTIRMEKAGSIAEASLQLNDIFTVAQKAADEYLNSIKEANESMEDKQRAASIEADRVVSEAKAQAEGIIGDANEEATRIMTMAKEQAESAMSEARTASQQMTEAAQKRSQSIITAAESKRDQLEQACHEKAEETQKELEARWDAFENRVEDVLSQHRELSMLLKNVTAKPTMVTEPVISTASKEPLTKEAVSEK